MLLSGIMLKMAIYGVLRYLYLLHQLFTRNSGQVVMILSILGVVYGALIAIVHHDIKKIIAYFIAFSRWVNGGRYFFSAILTAQGNFTFEGAQGALVQTFCTVLMW